MTLFRRIGRDDRGATAVEYSFMVVLIAAVVILAVSVLGRSGRDEFDCAGTVLQLKGQCPSPGGPPIPGCSPSANRPKKCA